MRVLASTLLAMVVFCAETCYGATAVPSFIGEGYFVVDDKAVQMYVREIPGTASYASKRALAVTNLKKDIAYLAAEANKLIATMAPNGLNLEIRMRALTILDTNVFPSNVLQKGYIIDGDTSLSYFSQFLTNQKSYATYKQDFAVLFTGFDLSGDTGIYTLGIAFVGTVCDPIKAVAVVESSGTYETAEVLAHEIVHMFGGSHDGIASSRVMAATTSPQQKSRWEFSQCSATDIKEFLPLLSPNCLLTTNPSSTKLAAAWTTYTGLIFNADTICQRYINDTRSYPCLFSSLYNNTQPKGNAICQLIYCSIPGTSSCQQAYPSEGMICDKSKRCSKGKCVADSSPASAKVDTTCVLGDQKAVQLSGAPPFNGNCSDLIAQRGPLSCYSAGIVELCCATCKKAKTGIAGCDYGDKSSACKTLAKASACTAQNKPICCGTCHGYVGKRSTQENTEVIVLTEEAPAVVETKHEVVSEDKTIRSS
jgi:hypothetical protein